jgi:hypothetical protein
VRLRALVACCVLVAAPRAAAHAPVAAESEPVAEAEATVEELETRAQEAFQAGRYDEVVELAAEAYARTGEVRHLYAQAHAERFRGHCEEALALYARVMAADPDGVLGQHARDGIKLCEEQLAHAPAPALTTDAVAKTPPATPPPTPRDERRRPDPLGTVLVVLGAATLAVGASLAVLASSHARKLDRATDERTIVDEQRRARAFQGSAIGVSVLGTGLVIGGIVRLVQRSRRARHP